MKMALTLILFVLSASTFARSIDTRSFYFDGRDIVKTFNLDTEKTHVEYREVRVPSTCYRTEYRYQCQTMPGQCQTVCRAPGQCERRCSPPQRVCRNVPVQVPYSCTRIVREPYDVFDYYVRSQVDFTFIGDIYGTSENFTLTQNQENLSLSVRDSKRFAISARQTSRGDSFNGNTKFIRAHYEVELINIEKSREAFRRGFYDVRLSQNILSFKVLEGFDFNKNYSRLKIFQNRAMATDILLLDREVRESDFIVRDYGREKEVSIDLSKLGIVVPSKLRVILESEIDFRSKYLLNQDISSDLKTFFNYIFK